MIGTSGKFFKMTSWLENQVTGRIIVARDGNWLENVTSDKWQMINVNDWEKWKENYIILEIKQSKNNLQNIG